MSNDMAAIYDDAYDNMHADHYESKQHVKMLWDIELSHDNVKHDVTPDGIEHLTIADDGQIVARIYYGLSDGPETDPEGIPLQGYTWASYVLVSSARDIFQNWNLEDASGGERLGEMRQAIVSWLESWQRFIDS